MKKSASLKMKRLHTAGIAAVLFTSICEPHAARVFGANPADQVEGPSIQTLPHDSVARIETVITEGIQAGEMPGCVVAVGRFEQLLLLKAWGHRQLEPTREPMTTDTVFDMASVTKPVVTATSIMLLRDRGKLQLEDPVARHWPEFGAEGKTDITIQHLLTHTGGLIADNRIGDYEHGIETAWARIASLKPQSSPGERFVYSDVSMLVLGHVVERLSRQPLDAFAAENIFRPLGMTDSGYRPGPELHARIAPTEKRGGAFIRGEVHDPRAHLLNGVAGHAGLFSTATDLARYAAMMTRRGRLTNRGSETPRLLSEDAWVAMTTPHEIPRGRRALGWDSYSGFSSNRGQGMSCSAVGHGGFTGTAFWIDPESGLFVIFLSNRLHPDGKGSVNQLAGRVGTIAAEAVMSGAAAGN